MSISILILSHNSIGTALLNTVKQTFGGELPLATATVEITPDADPELLIPKLKKVVTALNQGDGVLILTDLYGSTPSNIAQKIQACENTRIVTGLNLPMLLRVMNYPNLSLSELVEKARSGGQCGIMECDQGEKSAS